MTPAPLAIHVTDGRNVGALLRRLRLAAGLTLDQVGARVHITRKGVCARELHARAVTAGALIETARALDYDVLLVRRTKASARDTGTGWPA